MYPSKTKRKFEGYVKVFIGFTVLLFCATVYILSNNLTYLTDNVYIRHNPEIDTGMKTVVLMNHFDHEISVHYDDGETGLFLAYLGANEKITLSAAIGQGLFVTETNGWDRIDFISIRPDIKEYVFSSHVHNELKFRQLNVEKRVRPHPSVVMLPHGVPAFATRFKSLSGRDVELWFEDGRGGMQQGKLACTNDT